LQDSNHDKDIYLLNEPVTVPGILEFADHDEI